MVEKEPATRKTRFDDAAWDVGKNAVTALVLYLGAVAFGLLKNQPALSASVAVAVLYALVAVWVFIGAARPWFRRHRHRWYVSDVGLMIVMATGSTIVSNGTMNENEQNAILVWPIFGASILVLIASGLMRRSNEKHDKAVAAAAQAARQSRTPRPNPLRITGTSRSTTSIRRSAGARRMR